MIQLELFCKAIDSAEHHFSKEHLFLSLISLLD
jgi:hypothetical protein